MRGLVVFSALVGTASAAKAAAKAKTHARLHAGVRAKTGVVASPIDQAMQMLSTLQQQIIGQGEEAQKVYTEFAEICEERWKDLQGEIKSSKGTVENLEAAIEASADHAASSGTKIEELSSAIATDEADVKASTLLREKEASDFGAEETDLLDTIDTLERAITVLEKEMQGGAAFTQVQVGSAKSFEQALSVMVSAEGLGVQDVQRLTELVQTNSDAEDSEEDSSEDEDTEEDALSGAPAAASYQKKSGSIVDTMESLLEKAQSKLEELRAAETKSMHAYELFKESLVDKLKFANRDMDAAKKAAAEAGEKKATAEGDLSVTKKDMVDDKKTLEALHHDCLTKANSFQEETKSRGEELTALVQARKLIEEAMGTSQLQTAKTDDDDDEDDDDDTAATFLQIRSRSKESSPIAQVNRLVRKLARSERSRSLMQLATRVDSAVRHQAAPFEKVKGLLQAMLDKLLKEAEAEATHKAYCDKEMSETQAKQDDKDADMEKLSTSIDQMSAKSAKLKEEVGRLSKELSEIAKAQGQMDRVRQEEKGIFEKDKPVVEQGILGLQKALKVLRDYYQKDEKAHDAQEGGASGIISLLEVAESDLTKQLSDMNAAERDSVQVHEDQTQENKLQKSVKDEDVKFKTKAAKSLDKAASESSSDRDSVQEELDAIHEYFAKIKESCVAKAEPYEERKKRRETEIAGLKEAMKILEGDGGSAAVFLQLSSARVLQRA